jgi:hypothetical protein
LIDPTGFGVFQQEMIGLDAASVAVANSFDQGIMEGIYGGTLVGTSPLLESIGISDELALEPGFDTLMKNADSEFGHMGAWRDLEIEW